MQPDIVDLQEFYQTRLGLRVRWTITRRLTELWPDNKDMRLLGVGYAAPYLRDLPGAERRLAMMPAWQGAAPWPRSGPNSVFLSRDDELPLPDRSIDRILFVHALECCRNPKRLLRETWRVLADGGRLIAVVPNRTGLWSLSDSTPFGTGQPYNMTQLETTLRRNLFTPLNHARALYLPPVNSTLLFRLMTAGERVGAALIPHLSGTIIVEAEKQIYAGTQVTVTRRARARQYITIPEGVANRARRSADITKRAGSR